MLHLDPLTEAMCIVISQWSCTQWCSNNWIIYALCTIHFYALCCDYVSLCCLHLLDCESDVLIEWIIYLCLELQLDPLTWGPCVVINQWVYTQVSTCLVYYSSRKCTQTFSLCLDWCIVQCGCTQAVYICINVYICSTSSPVHYFSESCAPRCVKCVYC